MSRLLEKLLNKETLSYIIFGVLTTVVDFVVFGVLHYYCHLHEVLANTIAWVAAVAFAYITNKLFVFQSKSFRPRVLLKEISSFVLARVLTLILTDIFLIFAGYIQMNMMFAKAIISVLVIIINYVFSKLIIFKNKQ
ncbi:MAG: GtrA family protein [Lachnospiraceae bacterium]|nr:GtrA family protein [Lachnospiraceae bacterium]